MSRWVASVGRQWRSVIVLTAIWVILWGDLSAANLFAGAIIAALVITVMPLPAIDLRATFRPAPFLALASHFVWDLIVASLEVSLLALRPGRAPRGAVVGVRLRSRSDVFLTMTAELSSLVPGSVVVEAHWQTGTLYLHVLDVDQSGGVERVRAETLDLEARVLRAFATSTDLAGYGLAGPRRSRAGTA